VDQLDYPPHIHNAVELVFLTQGTSTAYCDTETVLLRPGDIFVAFPNQIHSYEKSRDVRGYVMILPAKPCLTAYNGALTRQLPDTARIPKGTWEHTGILPILEQAYLDKDTASPAVMQGYIQVIFGKLLALLTLRSAVGGSGDALRAVIDYIGGHYREPLTRSQIARAVGYNESYISHLFSGMLHTTVPEYIHTLRLYDAMEMLTQSDLPVTRIAAELGFGSIRNFNRVFQREMGESPRSFRLRRESS
jgi:AraC-like DNA-binding protein